jgi:hypothetical protein
LEAFCFGSVVPPSQLLDGVETMICLDGVEDYLKKVKTFRIATLILIESAIEDVLLTLENISKYGIEIEGNPILRMLTEQLGAGPGICIPKILALVMAVYTAHRMNSRNYGIRGEYFLYGASLLWLAGAVAHLFLK